MTLADLYAQFATCTSWEARYRLLIQLSRQLPKPTDAELADLPEIHGCESRLWFRFELEPRRVQAYSDARLMQGILFVICMVLNEKSAQELADFSFAQLFDELKISQNLTSTRQNGIKEIQRIVREGLQAVVFSENFAKC